VNDFGLTPRLKTEYENISHKLVCALSERWLKETSNFHMLVGEMTVTLDDVACLLHIPITGRLIEEDELSNDHNIELLQNELCFTEEDAVGQVVKHCGAHVSYTTLKRRYEELLNRCNQLVDPDTEEEVEEQSVVRIACVNVFLLLLLGYTLFAARTTKLLICCGCLRFMIWMS